MDNLLKYFGVVAGAVAGIIALFSFMGFLITLSFIDHLQLYGIPKFPEEFFKEAGIQFLRDFVDHLGEHWHLATFLPIFLGFLYLAFISGRSIKQCRSSTESKVKDSKNMADHDNTITSRWLKLQKTSMRNLIFSSLRILLLALIGLLIYLTSTKEFLSNKEHLIYLISIPALFALGMYLGVYMNELVRPSEWQRNAYGIFLILFLILAVAILFSYGRYIYDFPVYYVRGFEYHANYESELLKGVRDDINAGKYVVVMGHTSGKEVLFRPDKYPCQMILIDSNAVKLLIVNQSSKPLTLREVREGGIGNFTTEDQKIWTDYVK